MILEKFKLASVVSRRAAVKRIRCPVDVLAYALIEDPDWNVRMSAAEHVGCPVEAMRKYYSLKIDENVTTLIQHPNCPGDILAHAVLNSINAVTRYFAADHPNCPVEALAEALNDRDDIVRRVALRRV